MTAMLTLHQEHDRGTAAGAASAAAEPRATSVGGRAVDSEGFQSALVYGWGRSGRAIAELLASEGVEVIAVDDRERPDSPVPSQSLLAADLKGLPEVDVVVPSPGVPLDRSLLHWARSEQVPVLGELELASRRANGPLLCITGSNGKSTTTELVGALLRSSGRSPEVCGNIGRPLSEAVLDRRRTALAPAEGDRGEPFVVEVSSFQLETVEQLKPKVAALLNLSPDHLDRHGTLDCYLETKRRLFRRQSVGDVAVLNWDDELVSATELPQCVRRRWFRRGAAVDDGAFSSPDGTRLIVEPDRRELRADCVRLQGSHNLENVLAALTIVDSFESVERGAAERALAGFEGLEHRLQMVAECAGTRWFDDSKGTNVAATVKSLLGFADRSVILILGGTPKGQDFSALRPVVERKAVATLLIGEASEVLAQTLAGLSGVESTETLENAVTRAAELARSGRDVVLSPACASFDQFSDYAHRGRRFRELSLSVCHPEAEKGGLDG